MTHNEQQTLEYWELATQARRAESRLTRSLAREKLHNFETSNIHIQKGVNNILNLPPDPPNGGRVA